MATSIYEFGQIPASKAGAVRRAPRRRLRTAGEAPRVGVIYNPRSHRNLGADFDCGVCPHVHIAQPGARDQLPQALAELAERDIDLLVINGGDGTVRDVLTCGHAVFGDDWPAIAVLPKGKTNALTVDLGVPVDWTLQNAIDAVDQGGRIRRRPMVITPLDEESSAHGPSQVMGFIFGAGAFTTAIRAGQGAHRLGAFNSIAVGVTTLWAIMQAVFASRSNPWRRGARMELRLGEAGTVMEHSGQGDPDMRQILFASTLERLPAGINPFGRHRHGLKLAVLDQISRRTTTLIPAMLMDRIDDELRDRGIHRLTTSKFTLDIGDQFILDGEAFPAGKYLIEQGPELEFVTP